ncbi:MAG TPA: DUF4203 domain-containing protein [Candidatus Saccharimonadales bacterium]|nr:DUF4203 domain-containing protein [Candidatus Saccharimonadales bacterium]
MTILYALLCALVGLALLAGGYRIARLIIPLAGFLTGLSLGGSIISDLTNTGFLGSLLNLAFSILVGAAFAVFAYLYYEICVIVLCAALGYWLGSGFMYMLGAQYGILPLLTGIGLGIGLGVVAHKLHAPKYFLMLITAMVGSVLTVSSLLLLFGQIDLESFSYASAHVAVNDSAFWSIITALLAVLGVVAQARFGSGYQLKPWGPNEDRIDPSHLSPTSYY